MILSLAYYDHPVLRKKTQPVEKIDDSVRKLVADMIETMHHHDGAGLAAPQVFQSLALFITYIQKYDENGKELPTDVNVYINPKILSYSKETWTRNEGCLSIPNLYSEVIRPVTIKVQATNLDGEVFERTLSGWDARTFLHENDHINGVLFIDRVKGAKRKEIEPFLLMTKKKYGSKFL